MSADTLRRAAEEMRSEYETDPYRLGQTMRAVADWLDNEALVVDDMFGNDSTQRYAYLGPAFEVACAYLGGDR